MTLINHTHKFKKIQEKFKKSTQQLGGGQVNCNAGDGGQCELTNSSTPLLKLRFFPLEKDARTTLMIDEPKLVILYMYIFGKLR